MPLLVQKFGGTSVADAERIRAVAEQVARRRRQGDQIVLVVSAMGKETDELLRLADEVSDGQSGREMDMLVTAGERKAIALVAMAIESFGFPAQSFTGSQAGFLTDATHRNARILEVGAARIREALDAGSVPVVAGAQGVSTGSGRTASRWVDEDGSWPTRWSAGSSDRPVNRNDDRLRRSSGPVRTPRAAPPPPGRRRPRRSRTRSGWPRSRSSRC